MTAKTLPVMMANQQATSLAGDSKTAAFNFTGTCLPSSIYGTAALCRTAFVCRRLPGRPQQRNPPAYSGRASKGQILVPEACRAHLRPDKVVVPTVDAWNATVQRQLTNSMSVDVAYVGTHGTHVFRGDGPTYNNNQPTIVGFASGVSRDARAHLISSAFSTPYTYSDAVQRRTLSAATRASRSATLGTMARTPTMHSRSK